VAKEKEWTVRDPVRRKNVADGPEERVRQAVLSYLTDAHGVPEGLISVETGVAGSSGAYRSDIVVYTRNGTAWMLIECKAPHIQIDQFEFDQIGRYNRHVGAPFLMITNGVVHYCCAIDSETGSVSYLSELPEYT
jgi:hypothetical protein